MKFLRSLFSKNSYIFLTLSTEVLAAFLLVLSPLFYPHTAKAGIFSVVSGVVGTKVDAKALELVDSPNSQTMGVLKAVVNSNPSPANLNANPILASENALVAEIGPAGTASEVDETTNTQISTYVVRKGDTLSEIAKMFGVSVNTIVWANNLNRNVALKEGQNLIILPITGIRYTIKKGDTIKGIVSRHKADIDEVLQFNDLSLESKLVEGKVIIIPDAEIQAPVVPANAAKNPTSPLRGTEGPSYAGYYSRPIVGGRKSQDLHGHNGIDFAAPVGTPIYASAAGTVIISKNNNAYNGGYGNYVVIAHSNGTQTLYAHNLSNAVEVGEKVKKGQLIGKIGMTGKTTGPHVHFEIRGAKNPF